MKHWGELTLSKKEHLISKYGVTAVGNPPEPLNAKEYFKIPEEEFGVKKVEKKKKVKKVQKVSKEVKKKSKSQVRKEKIVKKKK